MALMPSYYIKSDENVTGPFPEKELRKMAHEGKIKPTDEIRRKHNWHPASKVTNLYRAKSTIRTRLYGIILYLTWTNPKAALAALGLLCLIPFCIPTTPDYIPKKQIPLPTVPDLESILNSDRTFFYKFDPLYQAYTPPLQIKQENVTLGTTAVIEQPPVWNVFPTTYQPELHANLDFPWETTVGLNAAPDVPDRYGSINFVHLPKPILVINEQPIKWIFPAHSVVGEILWVKDSEKLVFEIRTRTKSPDSTTWFPKVYRPIKNREHLVSLIGEYTPAYKHLFFRNIEQEEIIKLEGLVERLPPLNKEDTKNILHMTFTDVTDEQWTPCSDQEYSILPRNYALSLIGIDQESCSSCHRQTQTSTRNLFPSEPIIKYSEHVGNIRGSDGIFTWHPFDKKSFASGKLRQFDIDNNIIEIYDGSNADYKLTKYVQLALKEYELPPKPLRHD